MKVCLALFSYGGVEGELVDSLSAELQVAANNRVQVYYSRIHGDALISRSRSKAMSAFLQTGADVFFMLDHDIEWPPGQLLATCAKAYQMKAMVSGVYANRAIGAGIAGRPKAKELALKIGRDELHEATYLPAGFIAIPRSVVEEVLEFGKKREISLANGDGYRPDANSALTECAYLDGSKFYDFFRPIVAPHSHNDEIMEYLSEDWAFCWRAREAKESRPQYLWSLPYLRHWGRQAFTVREASELPAPSLVKP